MELFPGGSMLQRYFGVVLLGVSLLPLPLMAQAAVVAPAPQEWKVQAPVYFSPEAVDIAGVLPTPPAPGSLAAEADLEAVLMAQTFRGPEQEAWAQFSEADGVFKHAPEIGPWFTAQNLPLCEAFFRRVLGDAHAVSERAKRLHVRPRPPRVDPRVHPCVRLPGSTSYPSAHSMQAFLMAAILGELLPEQRELLLARAHRAAWSRIIGGVHFPTDDVGGRLLARAILAELQRSPAYRADLEGCRVELEAQARARRSRP